MGGALAPTVGGLPDIAPDRAGPVPGAQGHGPRRSATSTPRGAPLPDGTPDECHPRPYAELRGYGSLRTIYYFKGTTPWTTSSPSELAPLRSRATRHHPENDGQCGCAVSAWPGVTTCSPADAATRATRTCSRCRRLQGRLPHGRWPHGGYSPSGGPRRGGAERANPN